MLRGHFHALSGVSDSSFLSFKYQFQCFSVSLWLFVYQGLDYAPVLFISVQQCPHKCVEVQWFPRVLPFSLSWENHSEPFSCIQKSVSYSLEWSVVSGEYNLITSEGRLWAVAYCFETDFSISRDIEMSAITETLRWAWTSGLRSSIPPKSSHAQ